MTAAAFDAHRALLDWYERHQRDLPWRRDPSPYRVFVSELMLQQTQVDRVIPYFERFVERFPTVHALAAASRVEVIQVWAGLGYNRRAVYLHEAARAIVERHGGEIPDEPGALRALPGIGEYTAGAILSIAFGRDAAAADTNALRVVERFAFGQPTPRAQVSRRARELVPSGRARTWNQALMDLGSSLCTVRAARCLLCPLRAGCKSVDRVGGRAGLLSTAPKPRSPKQPPFTETTRYFRGRMLAALRDLEPDLPIPLERLTQTLTTQGVAEPSVGWGTIGTGLARDGLASLHSDGPQVLVGLPG